jgi:SAM-dependent methyltransferase
MDAQNQNISAWTRYWQDGHEASCGPVASDRLSGDLWDSWRAIFLACPAGGRVLELGCGNGALLRRALETTDQDGLGLELTGIDLAEIQPYEGTGRIELRGGVAMEQLPFADAGFDIVFSQYAFEYSDWQRSIAEMIRVLRPGGKFGLLMHSAASRIVERSARQCAALEHLLASGLPVLLDQAMIALAAAAQEQTASRLDAARQGTVQLVALLDRLDADDPHPDAATIVAAALAAIRAAPRAIANEPPETALAAARELIARIEAQIARFRDLARAALSDTDIESMMQHLARCGAAGLECAPVLVTADEGAQLQAGIRISGIRV